VEVKLKGYDELRAPKWARKGPIGKRSFVREHHLLQKGDVHPGERHSTDHVTVLRSGKVRFQWRDAHGQLGSEVLEASPLAPLYIEVEALHWHTFEALDGPASFDCLFFRPNDTARFDPYHGQEPPR
jgi:hypothetical protein